jgi:hypothetical protein
LETEGLSDTTERQLLAEFTAWLDNLPDRRVIAHESNDSESDQRWVEDLDVDGLIAEFLSTRPARW